MKPRKYLLFAVSLIVVLASCGGGGEESEGVASIDDLSTETTSGVESNDEPAIDEEKVLEFAACMRDNDIDFPDPVVDADGNVGFDLMSMRDLAEVDEDEMQGAFDSCVQYLEGVNFGFEQVFDVEFQDRIVVFAGCMRENGIDMPDPDFSRIMDGEPLFPGWEPELDDPDFEAAFEACEDLLPGIPGIAGSG